MQGEKKKRANKTRSCVTVKMQCHNREHSKCRTARMSEGVANAKGEEAVRRYEELLARCGCGDDRGQGQARAELRSVLWEQRPACPACCRARVWEALLGCGRTSDAEDRRLYGHIANLHGHYAARACAEAAAAAAQRQRAQNAVAAPAADDAEEGFVVVERPVAPPDRHERAVLQKLDDVRKDVCRTHPAGCGRLVQTAWVQALTERVLFVWSVEDADGYFQGLNDLLVPCVVVLVAEAAGAGAARVDEGAAARLDAAARARV